MAAMKACSGSSYIWTSDWWCERCPSCGTDGVAVAAIEGLNAVVQDNGRDIGALTSLG